MGTVVPRLHRRQYPVAEGDAALMAAVQRDRQAFAQLYDRYFDVLYRYCFVRLGSASRAEDATQQIFVQVLEAADRYQEQGRFRSWLFTIAHNVVTKERLARPPDFSDETMQDVIDSAAGPETAALAALEHHALWTALAQLPPDQRRAMELRLAGWSGREIAHELGRSHEAIKMLQHRAVARLRGELRLLLERDAR
ncbi:MAG: sigma-70 family RNA polymerase sigma factor [Thermomicrobiales bacterium]